MEEERGPFSHCYLPKRPGFAGRHYHLVYPPLLFRDLIISTLSDHSEKSQLPPAWPEFGSVKSLEETKIQGSQWDINTQQGVMKTGVGSKAGKPIQPLGFSLRSKDPIYF